MNDDQARTMLRTMARMQDEHNTQVHAEWRTQGYEYYRAIWVECAEMLDHFGWKWWKAQSPDIDQVKLELVDIWHFGLSELLRADALSDDIVEQMDVSPDPGADRLRLAIEALAGSSLSTRGFSVPHFAAAMAALPLGYEELYRLYVGKNVLNRFRQNHGYKAGSYIKVWQGREDNEHLIELLDRLDLGLEDAPEQLYSMLEERYAVSAAS